jgi:nucleoside-diphosphate-sugar epimerase
MTDGEAVAALVKRIQPDQIYHLAGSARVSDKIGVPEYFRSNFLTTAWLARAVKTCDHPVAIFFSSSVHVYGNRSGIVDEGTEPQPVSPYGFSKYLAELALKDLVAHGPRVRVVIGRMYSCIGPGQAEGFLTSDLSRRLADLKEGEPLRTGPLTGSRRFLDVRDAVSLFPQLLVSPRIASGDCVNIAPAEEVTIREVVDSLLRVSGKSPALEGDPRLAAQTFTGVGIKTEKLRLAVPDFHFRPLESTLRDIWDSVSKAPSSTTPG